jgi:hypothetical protein
VDLLLCSLFVQISVRRGANLVVTPSENVAMTKTGLPRSIDRVDITVSESLFGNVQLRLARLTVKSHKLPYAKASLPFSALAANDQTTPIILRMINDVRESVCDHLLLAAIHGSRPRGHPLLFSGF